MSSKAAFREEKFQGRLLGLICRDRAFLRDVGSLLTPGDFKSNSDEHAWERHIVAELALDWYKKYREPIGEMLQSEVLDIIQQRRLKGHRKEALKDLVEEIKDAKLKAMDAVRERVVNFKSSQAKDRAIEEMIELRSSGELTDAKWLEIAQGALVQDWRKKAEVVDYFKTIEERILRRELSRDFSAPLLFIDPLDQKVKGIGPGQLGLVLAPYKRGKSLCLIHLSKSYAMQALNVLHFTLEDNIGDVEDRYDAAISALPIQRLNYLPKKLRRRFLLHRRLVRGRLKIIDGTNGGMTMRAIEEMYLEQCNKGFKADVVVIDYDDEIVPPKKQKDRRFEFADIYRDFRQFAAKYQLIVWTAAQSNKKSGNMKIITGDEAAEDISKVRKVTMCISLGKGDWGEDSYYLYVAAHKNDRQHIGWNIMSDRSKMLFYDRDATIDKMRAEASKPKGED